MKGKKEHMDLTKLQAVDIIKQSIKTSGIKLENVAVECGVSKQHIQNALSPYQAVSNHIIINVAKVAGWYLVVSQDINGKHYNLKLIK